MDQPIINVACLGCVSDGKSSLVRMLTGIKTQKHSSEKERNITIKLGYANCKIFKCDQCPIPDCYYSSDSKTEEMTCDCGEKCILVNHISFIDAPGHDALFSTLLSGINIMDYAIVVVSGKENIESKPKLNDHLFVIKECKIDKPIYCLNKLDLLKQNKLTASTRKDDLKYLIEKELDDKDPLIIPTSFNLNGNKQWVIHYLNEMCKEIKRNDNENPHMVITRTFDVNPCLIDYTEMKGGVVGGSIVKGKLKVGDEVEISPGAVRVNDGKLTSTPFYSKIKSIRTETTDLEEAKAGGLIALQLDIDPYFTKNDRIIGQRIGLKGTLPEPVSTIKCKHDIDINKLTNENYHIVVNGNRLRCKLVNKSEDTVELKTISDMVSLDDNCKIVLSEVVDKNYKVLGIMRYLKD